MPIVWTGAVALFFAGAGLVVGGGVGAVIAHLLHLRGIRVKEIEGAAVRPEEEFSSGCGALLAGSLLGGLLGCGALLGVTYLVARFGE